MSVLSRSTFELFGKLQMQTLLLFVMKGSACGGELCRPVKIEFMHGRAKAATTLPVSFYAAMCLSLAFVCRCSRWIPVQTNHARCLKQPASMCNIREQKNDQLGRCRWIFIERKNSADN
jgi:hypothetical protein